MSFLKRCFLSAFKQAKKSSSFFAPNLVSTQQILLLQITKKKKKQPKIVQLFSSYTVEDSCPLWKQTGRRGPGRILLIIFMECTQRHSLSSLETVQNSQSGCACLVALESFSTLNLLGSISDGRSTRCSSGERFLCTCDNLDRVTRSFLPLPSLGCTLFSKAENMMKSSQIYK